MHTPNGKSINRTPFAVAATITASLLCHTVSNAQDDSADKEEIFELSPFTVDGSTDNGYQATSTLSGSQLRTDLKDVGSAISVVTEAFLEDTGSTNLEEVLTYTTSTEVGGLGGNFGGDEFGGDPAGQSARMTNPATNTRIRGLDSADLTRDFFRTNIGMDSYNTSRVDINRGASALLYGTGSPAGIINNTLKSANLAEDEYKFSIRLDQHGSHREIFDMNRVIKEDVLGIRLIGLNDEREYQQRFAHSDKTRLFTTAKWTPKFGNDSVYTEVGLTYETGTLDSNRPRTNTPRDLLSTWWIDPDGDGEYGKQPVSTDNTEQVTAGNTVFYSRGFGDVWWDEIGFFFNDPNSGLTGGSTPDATKHTNGTPGGATGSPIGYYQNIEGGGLNSSFIHPINEQHRAELEALGVDVYARGLWQTQNILDPTVFNFYDNVLEGPNKSEFNDFDVLNASLSQTFFDGKLGYKLTVVDEAVERGYVNNVSGNGFFLTIDNNAYLRGNDFDTATGQPNPNLGRAAFAASNSGQTVEVDTEAFRATAFYTEDFRERFDSDSLLARILGKHTITGTYGEVTEESFTRNYRLYGLGTEYIDGGNFTDDTRYYVRPIKTIHYLGDSLLDASAPTNLNIPGITAVQSVPGSAQLWAWNREQNPTPYQLYDITTYNYKDHIDYLYSGANGNRRFASNETAVWQGSLWDETISTLIGYRKDTFQLHTEQTSQEDRNPITNAVIPPAGGFTFLGDPELDFEAETWTGSIVLHSPQFIKDRLPKGMDISLSYNESENFDPGQVGFDVYGDPHPAPSGSTKDYGVLVTALNGKLSVKANWYKADSANSRLTGTTWSISRNEHVYHRGIRNGMRQGADPSATGDSSANSIPNWIMNDWMFGEGNWDTSIANQSLDPSLVDTWRTGSGSDGDPYVYDESVFDPYLDQPLRVRAAADPNSSSYVGGTEESRAANPYPVMTPLERAYLWAWYNARSDAEFLRPLDPDFVESVNFYRNEDGVWAQDGHRANTFSIADLESKGFELEVSYNPNENWRFMFNAAQQKAVRSNVAKDFDAYVEKNVDLWLDGWDTYSESYWDFDGYADISFWSSGSTARIGRFMEEEVYIPYLIAKESEGRATPELREWRTNAVVNYSFKDGKFSGLNIGGAARWQDEIIIGYYPKYITDLSTWISDLDRPIVYDAEMNFDFWLGFKKSIRNDTADWRIQLNIRNIFGDDDLIPVSAQPDGSIAQARIPSANQWSITQSISF